jgi:hypothetical protein
MKKQSTGQDRRGCDSDYRWSERSAFFARPEVDKVVHRGCNDHNGRSREQNIVAGNIFYDVFELSTGPWKKKNQIGARGTDSRHVINVAG